MPLLVIVIVISTFSRNTFHNLYIHEENYIINGKILKLALTSCTVCLNNKKVLLRERKRHTARRVAIAISCYCRGGVPWQKIFSPVWTCIKPNLVSKIFPFTETRYPPGPQNLRSGTPPQKIWDQVPPKKSETRYPPPPQKSETRYPPSPPKIWDWVPPPRKSETGTSPPRNWDRDLGPPPSKCGQTENITFCHPSDGGR